MSLSSSQTLTVISQPRPFATEEMTTNATMKMLFHVALIILLGRYNLHCIGRKLRFEDVKSLNSILFTGGGLNLWGLISIWPESLHKKPTSRQ